MTRRTALGVVAVGTLPITYPWAQGCASTMGIATKRQPDVVLASVEDLLDDPDFTYGQIAAQQYVVAGGFNYIIAPSGGTHHHLVTAGGVKLYVLADSIIRPEQFGALGDGRDEMDRLQSMLNFASGRGAVHLSRMHYIRPRNGREALLVRGDTRLIFETGGSIENLPHDCIRYEMLKIHDVNNVEIRNAVLDGRRDLNVATSGEWGNGIQILGDVNDIRIHNPVTNNMWGDGIFIGQDLEHLKCPVSVEIWNHKADNCRRQGMSITAAHRCIVHNPLWTNTNGTLPQAGLDIEPDTDSAVLDDIRIIDPITRGNSGCGIMVFFNTLRTSSKPVSIIISGHVSDGDAAGGKFMRSGQDGEAARGVIRYLAPTIRNSKFSGIIAEEWSVNGPKITVDRAVIENPGASMPTADWDRSGISIYNYENNNVKTIGNIIINNPSISYTRKTYDIDRYIYIQNYKFPGSINQIKIIDPLNLRGAKYSRIDGQVFWSDKYESSNLNVTDTSNNIDIANWAFTGSYTNVGASGVVTLRLSAKETPVGWPDILVTAKGTHPIRILPSPTNSIVPAGRAGQGIEIPAGAKIRLRRKSSSEWAIAMASAPLKFIS